VDTRTREELIEENELLRERLAALEGEVEMLRSMLSGGGSGSSAVPFVKPNRKERREAERKSRKQRKQNCVRRRGTPTETVDHTVDVCPDCGWKLSGGWVARTREVIEIPDAAVRVIEHRAIARRCGVCGRVHTAKIDLSGQVMGKMRIGVRLMSLIAELQTTCRLPIEQIKGLLRTLYGLEISKGEISGILRRVAEVAGPLYDSLRDEIRGSPVVHADETGWREDGTNGYIWSFSTPRTRYFVYNRSRAAAVPKEALGEFSGRLVCDFYSAYGVLDVVCQRCWVHLQRDVKKLVDKHPTNQSVVEFADAIKDVYARAKAFSSDIAKHRLAAKMAFERELMGIALPYLGLKKPQSTLAGRIEKFLAELFVFVEEPWVPSDNNPAERSVRPSVIARKISGGTRSEKGSKTRMILMSIFGTWKLRGVDTMSSCIHLISDTPQLRSPQA
jgi:hypothetical protein